MGALFAHTVRMLVRQRDVLIWVILFPLALATLFHVMLSNIDESYRVDPASCVVVADDNFNSERAVFFREMLDEVSAPGAGQLLDVAKVATLEEGREAVLSVTRRHALPWTKKACQACRCLRLPRALRRVRSTRASCAPCSTNIVKSMPK